jgi:four helix bundle protein
MNHLSLSSRLVRFAGSTKSVAALLPSSQWGKTLAGQLIRSSLSVPLNYAEAGGAESTRDFLHKIQIVGKELRETAVNLEIIASSGPFPDQQLLDDTRDECNQLIAIFTSSINTVKRKIGDR